MPGYKTAKKIAENALKQIGAFSSSQPQANANDLRTTLEWLEMILNNQAGICTMAGFFRLIEIPLEADVGDYQLSDYDNAAGTQWVFSAFLVDSLNGDPIPLDILDENQAAAETLSDNGNPCRIMVTKDRLPVMKVYPLPNQTDEDAGRKIRIRIQTYHDEIPTNGIADSNLLVRPSWYLWLTKRTAYEIGCGPVRKLPEAELRRIQSDYTVMESQLLARDGQYNARTPPVTEPMEGSV